MSIISEAIRRRVEAAFTNKKSRATAFELLSWKTWPTAPQREEIGKRTNVTSKTVLKVLKTLREMDLFTEAEGSIPLYGDTMRRELKSSMEPKEPKERKEEGEPMEETEEPEEDMEEIRNKVFRMEAEIVTMRKNMETIVPIIKGLSAGTQGNPSTGENSPAQENPAAEAEGVETVEVEQVGASEDRLFARMEELLEKRLGPRMGLSIEEMSKEQLLELLHSSPEQVLGMLNPAAQIMVKKDVATQPETMRPIITFLNSFTSMAFDKSKAEGIFKGNISDFLNFCVYQYFEDRGWSIGWQKFDPIGTQQRRPA